MTTGHEEVRVSRGTPADGDAGRRALAADESAQLALVVGFVVLSVVFLAAHLVLDNTYGHLREHESAGSWAALGCGVVAGVMAVAITHWVARRSTAALCVLLVALVVAGVVFFPRQIDVSESWLPRPNERYACTGWEFRYYPPGTLDGSSTTFCIGLEHRIADG